MKITSQDKFQFLNNSILQHCFYWVVYILFFSLAFGASNENVSNTFLVQLIYLPPKILLVYFFIDYLFPKYLYTSKFLTFSLWASVALVITAIIHRYTDNYYVLDNYLPFFQKYPIFDVTQIVSNLVGLGSVLAIPCTIRIMQYLSQVQQREQLLAKEKAEAELLFLKNQINPHFLFNTLNSLYAMILKKSDQSLSMVLKLSELLRYLLYESNAMTVPLRKEIKCIQNFIELEKIRYGKRVEVSTLLPEENIDFLIAPNLLLPFIENSFKHSTKEINETAWISISLKINENKLTFFVENNIPKNTEKYAKEVGGIGLENVKKRLELLYSQNFQLDIVNDQETFSVQLEIIL